MLVSAIALTVVCVVSFTILPKLWWEPRKAMPTAPSGLLRPAVGSAFKAHSADNHKKAA